MLSRHYIGILILLTIFYSKFPIQIIIIDYYYLRFKIYFSYLSQNMAYKTTFSFLQINLPAYTSTWIFQFCCFLSVSFEIHLSCRQSLIHFSRWRWNSHKAYNSAGPIDFCTLICFLQRRILFDINIICYIRVQYTLIYTINRSLKCG